MALPDSFNQWWRTTHPSGTEAEKQIAFSAWQACGPATQAIVPAGLVSAAQAVVARWDSPKWKDLRATATYIQALREALTEVEPGPQPSLTDAQIREIFLQQGFTIKEGLTDLKPYCYHAAYALLAAAASGGRARGPTKPRA